MSDEREEDSHAENRERLLAAFDHRTEDRPLEAMPVLRHESRHEEHQPDEMREPVRAMLVLSLGLKAENSHAGNKAPKAGKWPAMVIKAAKIR